MDLFLYFLIAIAIVAVIIVKKTLVGNFMTSLDMAGFSITLLKLDAELEALLNAPADTPAFTQF